VIDGDLISMWWPLNSLIGTASFSARHCLHVFVVFFAMLHDRHLPVHQRMYEDFYLRAKSWYHLKLFCSKAPTSPHTISRMVDMLFSNMPDLKEVAWSQLRAEYGIDPLSDAARNSPPEEVNMEHVASIMGSLAL